MTAGAGVSTRAIWHDVECGGYDADLPLWRALADACGGPVLDVGAGTGRVALDLAGLGHDVTAIDVDRELLAALSARAGERGLTVRTRVADARRLEAEGPPGPFALVIVPMQTVQLLGGSAGRRAFLRGARRSLQPGGLLAMAVADALSAFGEGERPQELAGLPAPDELTAGGIRFRSQTVAITEAEGTATIHRVRTAGEDDDSEYDAVTLDMLDPADLEVEAAMAGFRRRPRREIPETPDYVGSTVVVAGA